MRPTLRERQEMLRLLELGPLSVVSDLRSALPTKQALWPLSLLVIHLYALLVEARGIFLRRRSSGSFFAQQCY